MGSDGGGGGDDETDDECGDGGGSKLREGAWSTDKGAECEPGSYKHPMRLGELGVPHSGSTPRVILSSHSQSTTVIPSSYTRVAAVSIGCRSKAGRRGSSRGLE